MEYPRHYDASLFSLSMGSYDLVSPVGLANYESRLFHRFVIEMQKVSDRPDNMPPDQLASTTSGAEADETIAKSIPETRKDK
jgi:hypothetical protein